MPTARKTYDELLEGRMIRRHKFEARAFDKMDRMLDRMDAAKAMIGELNSGKLYVYPVGGKYREGTRAELIDFLIRNNYA